ncbi:hypothetical protein LI064_16355 [Clostridium perfringens]|uniref:hypothetical protein n=1 Tax=Clostridium perfringens TaxID=1502 RepID=UPI0022471480|nr:hypothetical protein [Clostridium perfringens]MCX0356083.1 hypothetical protein [Clostridium perfringens]
MANIERVNLRLNLDDPRDIVIWNAIKDKKNKKGTYIKFLVYNCLIGSENSVNKNIVQNISDKNNIEESEFDDSINNEFD